MVTVSKVPRQTNQAQNFITVWCLPSPAALSEWSTKCRGMATPGRPAKRSATTPRVRAVCDLEVCVLGHAEVIDVEEVGQPIHDGAYAVNLRALPTSEVLALARVPRHPELGLVHAIHAHVHCGTMHGALAGERLTAVVGEDGRQVAVSVLGRQVEAVGLQDLGLVGERGGTPVELLDVLAVRACRMRKGFAEHQHIANARRKVVYAAASHSNAWLWYV